MDGLGLEKRDRTSEDESRRWLLENVKKNGCGEEMSGRRVETKGEGEQRRAR